MIASVDREAGFTLIEALVSLFVFALVAGGCVAMLGQTVQTQDRVGDAQEELRALQSARALLVADIAQLAPRLIRNDGNQGRPFIGVGGVEPDIRFVRGAGEVGADDQLSTSLVAVEYLLDEDKRLVRRTRNVLDPGAIGSSRAKTSPAQDIVPNSTTALAGGRLVFRRRSIPRAVSSSPLPRYGRVACKH
jgi:general secretion pathway protein J